MPNEQDELFASVDALLEQAAQDPLPEPGERKRLREAAGLSQDQVARALVVRRETVTAWESGRTEPRPPKRAAYIRLLEGLSACHPVPPPTVPAPAPAPANPAARPPQAEPVAVASEPATGPRPAVPVAPTPARRPEEPPIPAASRSSRRPAAKKNAANPAVAAVDPRFAHGPLAVLDGDGSAYCAGGLVLECPATDIPALVEWVLREAKLGAPRLHRNGKDADPLIVLSASAAERLGLPVVLEDRRSLRLPEDHTVVQRIAKAGWKLTKRGFGPWARVYRPAQSGQRQCVQLAVLPWDALDERAWGSATRLPSAELASVLVDYATRVITPLGSSAVTGLELMTALRPPTRAVKEEESGTWVSAPNPGALTVPVDPAPPEAPDGHPVLAGLYPVHHQRTPDQVLDEEACDWFRPLTDEECAKRFVVGIDVNMAFAAAANRLTVGLGPAEHVKQPVFDKALPGSWLVDLSHIDFDPRLPNPFTPTGIRPEGPAWYATPTVAYAAELGYHITPIEAYVRRETGPYLDAWYTRLRDAYLATMEQCGVTPGMDEADFLTAMTGHKNTDPGQAAVLSAIKATVKGGIGKLRERPRGSGWRPGEPWPALNRPTWRPDIRAAVIAAARINMHRKMLKLAAVGLYPVAVLSDCAVYVSNGPSPLDFLPRTEDGKALPGGFRLGVSPGMVKHEGTQDLLWAESLLESPDTAVNIARHIKGTDAAVDGE
ncbi:helix-turn-helix domain-containing protein [Streptomyces sp. NBC_01142]|uniref:telomere-associated protein Tap n=1 Tax=Streptomyces sp. NBC_01142 TaxID=2975865 RepID=UPI0022598E27|nr:helix-turn-helix transcriptional regulator [Streptomyces sp. NBC_01142]MCX4826823.1 helix-turn-helix domain-containing protein [Streptomyces sp. NBC_01142]